MSDFTEENPDLRKACDRNIVEVLEKIIPVNFSRNVRSEWWVKTRNYKKNWTDDQIYSKYIYWNNDKIYTTQYIFITLCIWHHSCDFMWKWDPKIYFSSYERMCFGFHYELIIRLHEQFFWMCLHRMKRLHKPPMPHSLHISKIFNWELGTAKKKI